MYLPLSRLLRLFARTTRGCGKRSARSSAAVQAGAVHRRHRRERRGRQVHHGAGAQDAHLPLAHPAAHRAGHDRQLPVPQRGPRGARPDRPQGLPRVLRPAGAAAFRPAGAGAPPRWRRGAGLLAPGLRHPPRAAAVCAAAGRPHSRGPQRAAAGSGRGAGGRRLHRLLHLRRRAHGRHRAVVPRPAARAAGHRVQRPAVPVRQLAEVSLAEVDAFGAEVWKTINEVNLVENIQPTRARATLVLYKDARHAVTRVGLRRF